MDIYLEGKDSIEFNDKNVVLPTPDQIPEPSRLTKMLEKVKLSDNLQLINDLFSSMESSIRLLGLCRKPRTFSNISIQVEILTKRKLSYLHLAQMKHIMPDSIVIEKILVHDDQSLCIIPELTVELLNCKYGSNLGSSDHVPLRNSFHARLCEFFKANSQVVPHTNDINIPEGLLPEPFNSRHLSISHGELPAASVAGEDDDDKYLENARHFPPTYRSRFSQKTLCAPNENISSVVRFDYAQGKSSTLSILEQKAPIMSEKSSSAPNYSECTSSEANQLTNGELSTTEDFLEASTPEKLLQTPLKLMSKTPMTPKNSVEKTTTIRSLRRRSLDFSLEELNSSSHQKNSSSGNQTNGADCRTSLFSKNSDNFSLPGTIDTTVDQKQMQVGILGEGERTKEMKPSSCRPDSDLLPNLLSTICKIFQSINCFFVTKQELLHKILFYDCEVLEIGQVEEKLKLLEELAPDWISRKETTSGDLIYCICKNLDPQVVHARLVKAT